MRLKRILVEVPQNRQGYSILNGNSRIISKKKRNTLGFKFKIFLWVPNSQYVIQIHFFKQLVNLDYVLF